MRQEGSQARPLEPLGRHWKRKRRLECGLCQERDHRRAADIERSGQIASLGQAEPSWRLSRESGLKLGLPIEEEWQAKKRQATRAKGIGSNMIDASRTMSSLEGGCWPEEAECEREEEEDGEELGGQSSRIWREFSPSPAPHHSSATSGHSNEHLASLERPISGHIDGEVPTDRPSPFGQSVDGPTNGLGQRRCQRETGRHNRLQRPPIGLLMVVLSSALVSLWAANLCATQTNVVQSDPRPTIYSGQVSFGLLLSAHSTLGTELSTSASGQIGRVATEPSDEDQTPATSTTLAALTSLDSVGGPVDQLLDQRPSVDLVAEASELELADETSSVASMGGGRERRRGRMDKRQIFDRSHHQQLRRRQQQQQQLQQSQPKLPPSKQTPSSSSSGAESSSCSQVNPNALYAGMGAIWASHQANLVGDSQLTIGTYVYDSCNDLDVGQRQSVRIVSNLNAFQQTTCESPRGSPISVTIAHGDNQLRAIQLLTSFRVPVITTKEHFALEDYSQLSRDQRRFLFSTAPSSRHLAVGALRFSKRIVSRSTSSPKLPNQFHKMSSKNGLIVISRNLPAKFIAYLTEMIPNHVNYEMLQSNQPIDQVRSVEALESILIKKDTSSAASSTSGASSGSSLSSAASSAQSSSESRISERLVAPPPSERPDRVRSKRFTLEDGDSSSGDSDADQEAPTNQRMLSPTILMFITPAEAIDLVTRLRNDLAEVSRYYSLIVTTREDISPALKTIFHRGGSRLCSGKAFYTISPKPDEINEFSRYFRDTVQMEGESSDHPLICEFAKYQASTKINADLDDVSTEPVIKAVWTAAAAFKSVHRRECASLSSNSAGGNIYTSSGTSGTGGDATSSDSVGAALSRSTKHGRQSGKSAHSECMVKMNKNMSNLVQRALKRLDVTINSTGLQALDGFRIKFDELNELMTNKITIKYINKECEITEIGSYSGFKDSSLHIDEETMLKSLESTLPDPWPLSPSPNKQVVTQVTTSTAQSTTDFSPSTSSATGESSTGSSSSTGDDSSSARDEPAANNADTSAGSEESNSKAGGGGGGSDEDESGGGDNDKTLTANIEGSNSETPKRTSKRSKGNVGLAPPAKRKLIDHKHRSYRHQQVTAPMGTLELGRGTVPGLADSSESHQTTTQPNDMSSTRAPAQLPTSSGTHLETTTTSTSSPAHREMRKFANDAGSSSKSWLVKTADLSTTNSVLPTTVGHVTNANRLNDESRHWESLAGGNDQRPRGTTQAPVDSTLPESGGNTDLEMPTTRNAAKLLMASSTSGETSYERPKPAMETSATTESSDYATLPSVVRHNTVRHEEPLNRHSFAMGEPTTSAPIGVRYQPLMAGTNQTNRLASADLSMEAQGNNEKFNYLRDLNNSPVPILSPSAHLVSEHSLRNPTVPDPSGRIGGSSGADNGSGRPKWRSKLKWIYSSWFALSILAANICGALLTLYVLTFLLMKNCDGSLDRENQGLRSMHLLAIIVVFFGSTLFIVYPTPGLCLLRTSWHNFALVLMFGSLLLQTMQMRSISSLGLGGRPNRVNQFLTLVFMVGVQIAFELQRWKYESANYQQFVNQFLGSSENSDKKLMLLNGAFDSHPFNPLNSFNDQVTPVSIQVSERYQSLLHDYCTQPAEDFLQSQIYLCLIVFLLVVFSFTTRKRARSPSVGHHHNSMASALTKTSGKLVASQHEANLDMNSSQFQFAPNLTDASATTSASVAAFTGNVFAVSLVSVPIYIISVVLHVYGKNPTNQDIIFSVTMVLIAFTTLVGIFSPVLRQVHRYEGLLASSEPLVGAPVSRGQMLTAGPAHQPSGSSSAFAMFPEFAPTGLRRPSSMSGDSSSGAGSRKLFADTKESRRNMGVALANLGPSADSLRSMGLYQANSGASNRRPPAGEQQQQQQKQPQQIDPALLNLQLNLNADDELSPAEQEQEHEQATHKGLQQSQHHAHHHHHQQQLSKRSSMSGEKRLIMLDVDPCCPRHGVGVWPRTDQSSGSPSRGCATTCSKSKQTSHNHHHHHHNHHHNPHHNHQH